MNHDNQENWMRVRQMFIDFKKEINKSDNWTYPQQLGDKPMSKKTMTRRFYATASAFRVPHILKTLGEAIQDAQIKIREGKNEEYYVVEIKRIVTRKVVEPPIDVIEVI